MDFVELFPGVFKAQNKIFTLNLVKGKKVYGEQLLKRQGKEYREWIPFRSKLSAALKNGLKYFPFTEKSNVLYLGCAEGTSCSHLSDICFNGLIVGLDFSAVSMKKFIALSEQRTNLLPLLADATAPEKYFSDLKEISFDCLFQDISQKNQVEIFEKNCDLFLEKGKLALLSLKIKSIDSIKSNEKIIDFALAELKNKFEVLQVIKLSPFEDDHIMIVCKKK